MPSPQRGDIFWAEVLKSETRGSEQFNRRPWLIVSKTILNSRIPVVVAVPLSTRVEKQNRWFRILVPAREKTAESGTNGCPGDSLALTEQIRVLSVERLDAVRAARVTSKALAAVEAGIAFVLDMPI